MMRQPKKTVNIKSRFEQIFFTYCKISNKTITQQFACAAGENFEIASISTEKNT